MSIFLGLDISTSNVGITVLDENKLLHASNLSLYKLENQYEKADFYSQKMLELANQFQINKVFIEEPLQRFARGLSSANTISTLARFNGIASYITYKTFGIQPELLSVTVARKSVGIKIPKKDPNSKEIVLNWVKLTPEFKNYLWPSKELKSGPRRGQVISDSTCYDIADSAVMAFYGRSIYLNS
jgi:hypothetical protein